MVRCTRKIRVFHFFSSSRVSYYSEFDLRLIANCKTTENEEKPYWTSSRVKEESVLFLQIFCLLQF